MRSSFKLLYVDHCHQLLRSHLYTSKKRPLSLTSITLSSLPFALSLSLSLSPTSLLYLYLRSSFPFSQLIFNQIFPDSVFCSFLSLSIHIPTSSQTPTPLPPSFSLFLSFYPYILKSSSSSFYLLFMAFHFFSFSIPLSSSLLLYLFISPVHSLNLDNSCLRIS